MASNNECNEIMFTESNNKTCPECLVTKNHSEFFKIESSKDGLHWRCIQCFENDKRSRNKICQNADSY